MFDRPWRIRPLARDPLPALVDKHRRVSPARVQLVEIPRHDDAGHVRPWTRADAVTGVGWTAGRGVAFHAQIRMPGLAAQPGDVRQVPTQPICARQPAEIARRAPRTGDEESRRGTALEGSGPRALITAGRDGDRRND